MVSDSGRFGVRMTGIRLLRDMFDISLRTFRTGKVSRPWIASFDITSRCNLNCSFCYWKRQSHPNELDDRRMTGMMQSLYRRGFKHAMVMGGEPMLRPEVAMSATRIFPFSFIFTNGTLGFDAALPTIWWLSLDGPEEVHDSLRGRGVFSKAVSNLESKNRPVIAHMTINRKN
jgi:sulfatase maturation enzyme AslB (radical SAM superfamily)